MAYCDTTFCHLRKGLRKTANTRNAVEVAARMSVELLLETFFSVATYLMERICSAL